MVDPPAGRCQRGRPRGRPAFFVGVTLLAGLALAACAGGSDEPETPPTPVFPTDGELTIRAFEWGYGPEAIGLVIGEPVRFELVNDGDVLHNLKIEGELEASGIESESSGPLEGDEGDLFAGADSGDVGALTFTPEVAGTYVFYCTIPDHRQFGMEGVLIVE